MSVASFDGIATSGDRSSLIEMLTQAGELAADEGRDATVYVEAAFDAMPTVELIAAIHVLHDMSRWMVGLVNDPAAVKRLLNWEATALVCVFMRLTPDDYVTVMAAHLPWSVGDEDGDDD